MYINTFKYTPKDVSCQLCTEYVKKLGCTALRCPWLAERIEAGVVGYREAVMETFPRDLRLSSRLNLLIKHYPGSLWSNEQHERRMQYQCAVQGYRRPGGRPFRYHHSAAEHDKRSLRFGHRAQDQGAAAAGHEGRQVHRCAYSLYLKAEDDCHQLIIDPVAAVVVQRMFRWASEGAGLNTIAVRLNEEGVLTPSHYKKMQGKITHANLLGSGKWQTRTVGVILRSEVYTGDLVQGQTKTVDHRQVNADAEEWTVVRDTHEAIISREQFAAVQEILNQTASRAKARLVKAYTPNLFKGKVFCAHCGGSLHRQRNIRKKSDDVYFYHCLSQS